MDREEVARRLERVRAAVREQLAAQGPGAIGEDAPPEAPFRLRPGLGLVIGGHPSLAGGEDLAAVNRLADPASVEPSRAPLLGPLVNLVRWLTRPLVKAVLGGQMRRQEELNAHAVRHLNALGNRLEDRVRGLEEALEAWSANPAGIEARLRLTLEEYDAALRQRHMILFSALEEELLAAHGAAVRVERLERQLVERARAVDHRFAEKDQAFETAIKSLRGGQHVSTRLDAQVAELMALRTLLKQAIAQAAAGDEATGAASGDGGADRPAGTSKNLRDRAPGRMVEGVDADDGTAGDAAAGVDLGAWLADEDYRAFQAGFRGDPEEIHARMRVHVQRFEGAPGVVADLGCGRGEFLDLLAEAGIEAIGVETNGADVAECRSRGRSAVTADLFGWLEEQAAGSLGGIFMAQVIEHLPPPLWQRLVELALSRLAAGAKLVIETINPESLYAMARAYVIDPTHARPVHPELLAFLARRAGFHPVEVVLQSPVPAEERPIGLPFFTEPTADLDADLAALKEALVRMDRICCAPQEYTLSATRPGASPAATGP